MTDLVPPPMPASTRGRVLVPLVSFIAGVALMAVMERLTLHSTPAPTPAVVLSTPSNQAHAPAAGPSADMPSTSGPSAATDRTASDASAEATAVASVNGHDITLRALEDALLKKEGAEQVEDAVHHLLDRTNWSRLHDDDLIVATAMGQVKRREVALHLLRDKSGPVREELINISLVEQALSKAGVVIDDLATQAELKRMEKRLHEGLDKRKQPIMDLRTFIQQSEKTTLEDFIRQPGFKMLAGLHILVQRQAKDEVQDAELKVFFDEHLARYRTEEAVDIADIYVPFLTERDAHGLEVVTEDEKVQRQKVAWDLYNMIQRKSVSFERTFATFGRNADQDAEADGRIGWVTRDGGRGKRGSRRIPARVVEEAFNAQGPFPVLLQPVVHDLGVDVIRVLARRPGQEAVLGLMRDRVLTDLVDAEIDARTKRLLEGLRRSSSIAYASLPAIIQERTKEAGIRAEGEVPKGPEAADK
jgi:hypothetical protein